MHGDESGKRRDVELHGAGGAACQLHRICHHQADHLADVLHGVKGEHRLIVRERSQQLVAWYVCRNHHTVHTGNGQRGVGMDTVQPAMCHVGKDGRAVQGALQFGKVVDVVRGTRYVGAGGFVCVRLAHGGPAGGRAVALGW